ncbi:tRNA (adenine(22)-N(1))-methyltransferase [Niallia sp. Krafla_26]|uniref:tRNA (adenine(22)-N(1))-methyltransferase n=1 Tax=Niallia sp. Krafla_26 TaxID=3064703 RepID=UPI003D165164
MNSEKLSKRLETVAKYVPVGARLADIGSDHAYLPCYLVSNGLISHAIAGEVVEGPYQSAKRHVEELGLFQKILVRKGDGLEVIQPGEVDIISIAGMGGSLIASILEQGKEKLEQVKRLVLQPNISAISIREWLLDNGWGLIIEEIIEEDDKIYEILVAERGNEHEPYQNNLEQGLLLGPYLLQENNPVFRKKWQMEKETWLKILNQLQHASPSSQNEDKRQELLKKIKLVEEILEK